MAAPMTEPTTAEIDTLVDTMVSGFVYDPLYAWLHPDAQLRPTRRRSGFELMLRRGLEHGVVHHTPDLDAVAIWSPPLRPILDDADLEAWLDQLRHETGPRFDAAVEGMAACADHEPDGPHWTLHSIVVDADRQGLGLGTSPLRRALDVVDESRLPAYLESSNARNVSTYERVGFPVIGEVHLRGGPVNAANGAQRHHRVALSQMVTTVGQLGGIGLPLLSA